ncbi:hypothetical protein V8C86DRAFT_2567770 [Haematococcus lacustris]
MSSSRPAQPLRIAMGPARAPGLAAGLEGDDPNLLIPHFVSPSSHPTPAGVTGRVTSFPSAPPPAAGHSLGVHVGSPTCPGSGKAPWPQYPPACHSPGWGAWKAAGGTAEPTRPGPGPGAFTTGMRAAAVQPTLPSVAAVWAAWELRSAGVRWRRAATWLPQGCEAAEEAEGSARWAGGVWWVVKVREEVGAAAEEVVGRGPREEQLGPRLLAPEPGGRVELVTSDKSDGTRDGLGCDKG